MFDLRLRHAHHVRHYTITNVGGVGWEVRLEEDRKLSRQFLYQDWHRVERAKALFEREVSELRAQGWQIARDDRDIPGSAPAH